MASATVACGVDENDAAPVDGPVVAIQDDRLPVAKPEELGPRMDMVAATGADVTRVDLFWADIAPTEPRDPTDPDDPAYDWTKADTLIQGFVERGIQPLVSTYNTPAWAATTSPEPLIPGVNAGIPNPGAYAAFMQAVVRRYSGDFTPEGASRTLPEVTHFEIWNEPNFGSFLGPQVEGGRRVAVHGYREMVEAAYPAMKAANADATVIVGVGGPRGSNGQGATGALPWLRALRAFDVPLDAYSQHIYPAAAPDVETRAYPSWSSIQGFLDELDEWKPGLDLYITEAGYTTSPTPYRKTSVSEEEQAQYLREIFALPQVNQERVAAIVWFNLQDNPGWPAGLLREDASKKPSYDVFVEVAEERRERRLPSSGDAGLSGEP